MKCTWLSQDNESISTRGIDDADVFTPKLESPNYMSFKL